MAATEANFAAEFSAASDAFLPALRGTRDMLALAEFAERWLADPRAWAREQLFRYLNLPWDCPGHEPLVKRLFKGAESRRDTELLAVFAVASDRLVRRELKRFYTWNWVQRTGDEVWKLVSRRNTLHKPAQSRMGRDPRTGQRLAYEARQPAGGRLFTYHTRYYLRRRTWRHFRQLAFQQPQEYPFAIAQALVLYTDEDLSNGINVIDSWTLAQACFRESPVLEFTASLVKVRAGQSLEMLRAAPRFPKLWQTSAACEVLRFVLTAAQARVVRVWALDVLREHHQQHLTALPTDALLELLQHDDAEVQEFAAECLERMSGLENLSVQTWLKFLQTRSLTGLETVCQVMQRHVSADRLSLADCVRLAVQEPTPVARLGFMYAQQKPLVSPADFDLIADLSETRCAALASEMAGWCLPHLGASEVYNLDRILRFFDSLQVNTRRAAWSWLRSDDDLQQSATNHDPVFWARLMETPFDETRLELIEVLEERSAKTSAPTDTDQLTPIWCSVLLGVHRGGRQKLKSIRQLATALRKQPDRADSLLPVLSVALRSVRRPEMREALAAVIGLIEASPELASAIEKALPEVTLVAADN